MMQDPESSIYSESYYNDIENDIFNIGSKDGGHLEFSFLSVSSCPSPARPNIDRPSYFAQQVHVDSGAQQLVRSNKRDEYHYHDEQMRSFESNRAGGKTYPYRDDQMRSSESSRSSGQYWLNSSRAGYSSYRQLCSGSSEAGGDNWSMQSFVCLTSPFFCMFNIHYYNF